MIDQAPTTDLKAGFWWVVLIALSTLLFFHHRETGWNVNTRLAVVVSIVEFGTFSIDGLHDSPEYFTNDKAYFEERFYSDKIFGVSLLALPFYWILYNLGSLVGWVPGVGQINYLLTLAAVKLPAALAVGVLWRLGCRLGLASWQSLLIALGTFLGSLWHGYSSIFMPYATGITACLFALELILFPKHEQLTLLTSLAVGLLSGFALLCDLIFVIAVFFLALLYLGRFAWERGIWNPQPSATSTSWLNLAAVVGGGLVFPLLFMAYSVSIFGTLTIPYQYEYLEEFRVAMSQGVMGVKTPRLEVMYFLTLHPFRGLFFWSPWILLALWGAGESIARRDSQGRILGLLVCGNFVGYLLFNSGYYMWWGGFGMGPRLMLPAFAVLPIGLMLFLQRPSRVKVLIVSLLLAWSMAANLPVSILEPQIPTGGNAQETLFLASMQTPLEIPQFVYWKGFWRVLWESLKGNPEIGRTFGFRVLAAVITVALSVVLFFRKSKNSITQKMEIKA